MKKSAIYTILVAIFAFFFLGYASKNWGGNHWPFFGTPIDRFFYAYGSVFRYVFLIPILIFSYKDVARLKPLAIISLPVMLVIVWFSISSVLWVITD